jgi:hypothetical protein
MTAFVFTGDPRAPGQDPKTCDMHGLTFELNGKPVEVKDEAAAEALRRHSHFTEAGKGAAKPAAPAVDLDNMTVLELRELADKRGVSHSGMNKAELQDALRG